MKAHYFAFSRYVNFVFSRVFRVFALDGAVYDTAGWGVYP